MTGEQRALRSIRQRHNELQWLEAEARLMQSRDKALIVRVINRWVNYKDIVWIFHHLEPLNEDWMSF